jgi:hypothetical protein
MIAKSLVLVKAKHGAFRFDSISIIKSQVYKKM